MPLTMSLEKYSSSDLWQSSSMSLMSFGMSLKSQFSTILVNFLKNINNIKNRFAKTQQWQRRKKWPCLILLFILILTKKKTQDALCNNIHFRKTGKHSSIMRTTHFSPGFRPPGCKPPEADPPSGCRPPCRQTPPPRCRPYPHGQTNACENFILPQTFLRTVNIPNICNLSKGT